MSLLSSPAQPLCGLGEVTRVVVFVAEIVLGVSIAFLSKSTNFR
jgi:hypothetical protein